MANIHRFLRFSSFIVLASCLPAVDPNDEDDHACWTSSDQYRASSEQYEESYFEKLVTTWEHISTTTITDVSITTLCDGKPRLLEPYKTITVTSIETLESPTPTVFQLPYTEPTPTCTIAESACAALRSSHHLGVKYCTTSRTWSIIPCTSDASQSCEIHSGSPKTLLYWPISTKSGDFCAQDGKTVLGQPTNPPHPDTAVVDGVTFTSPTAYMSFDYISADRYKKVGFREQAGQCGGPATEHVVFPITESLYSADYNGWGDQTWSFNFADLNTVPVEAYSRQYKCWDRWSGPDFCSGVFDVQAEYMPLVVIPTDLAGLKPEEWKAAGCTADRVAYDMTMFALATPAPTVVNKML